MSTQKKVQRRRQINVKLHKKVFGVQTKNYTTNYHKLINFLSLIDFIQLLWEYFSNNKYFTIAFYIYQNHDLVTLVHLFIVRGTL